VSSGVGTGHYLRDKGFSRAFVVGEAGLVETLAEYGVQTVDDERVPAVVVGLCRSFNYDLLREAMIRIRTGAAFVATNPDPTYPVEGGGLIPGAGSIVAAVRTASGMEPTIIGKPDPFLTRTALDEAGLDPGETLVVGDRMDTDIESGRRAGCDTFLVLTGVTTEIPPGQAGGYDLTSLP
jgi:4-nitrophenyl phosphatase